MSIGTGSASRGSDVHALKYWIYSLYLLKSFHKIKSMEKEEGSVATLREIVKDKLERKKRLD